MKKWLKRNLWILIIGALAPWNFLQWQFYLYIFAVIIAVEMYKNIEQTSQTKEQFRGGDCCAQEYETYLFCTLPHKHKGDHVAHGANKTVLKTWPK